MAETTELLIEIGTEELPPKALGELSEAFAEGLVARLEEAELAPSEVKHYQTPRRLAVWLGSLRTGQPERAVHRLGPGVAQAFDGEGRPTPAAEGFARSLGVSVDELDREDTDKGERLAFTATQAGRPAVEIVPEALAQAVKALPVPRPMRWGAGEEVFVRPVHWIVALLDGDVIPGSLFGQSFGRTTRGHRFHHPEPIRLDRARDYVRALAEAQVLVDPAERRALVRERATAEAAEAGGRALLPEALVAEVANLLEWPVAVDGSFDEEFLSVPKEALMASMEGHQRFFPVVDEDGELRNRFVGFINIDSRDVDTVRRGLERVIRPRLADARFFWDTDRATPLAERRPVLEEMVYQEKLGSLGDKSDRVKALAVAIAGELGEEPDTVARAAELAKCDLVTQMVYEFPELQGVMGRYYALADDEPEAVAWAIEEHYRPRFAGDELPERPAGRILAIADRLDTLAGIFAAGLKPSGNKDPFALRRAALGLIRLLVEDGPDLDLKQWLEAALAGVGGSLTVAEGLAEEVLDFVMDRLRAYYADRGIGTDAFEAVWARKPTRIKDFHSRVLACQTFRVLEPAAALAAAHKRIGNLLRKAAEAGETIPESVDASRLGEAAERELEESLRAAREDTERLLRARDYQATLERLAELRPAVDRFFDDVLVMVDDEALKANRLALLASLKRRFDEVAEVGRLRIEAPG